MHKLIHKCKALFINPFDALLKKAYKAKKTRFLIVWNRGLGDIPLGLYAMVYRIRQLVPHANITFITRPDLAQGFELLSHVKVIIDPQWERGQPCHLDEALKEVGLDRFMFDVVIEKPDPTRWVKWQLGQLTPRLTWQEAFDAKAHPFEKDGTIYIGVHLDSETGSFYGYNKNWDMAHFKTLFSMLLNHKNVKILLFGMKKRETFLTDGIVDLRGKTDLIELLATIKNTCHYLIAPDSGVLAMAYYLNASYPIKIVSLWADPMQGVLKQNVASPNPKLEHVPLLGKGENINTIDPKTVYEALALTP